MENILDDVEPAADTPNKCITSEEFDKELENAANELEENLFGLFETAANNDNGGDKIADSAAANNEDRILASDNPFDGDIILPDLRVRLPDPRNEQKQRDRAKRKELKNKREAEEEEREKMQ